MPRKVWWLEDEKSLNRKEKGLKLGLGKSWRISATGNVQRRIFQVEKCHAVSHNKEMATAFGRREKKSVFAGKAEELHELEVTQSLEFIWLDISD